MSSLLASFLTSPVGGTKIQVMKTPSPPPIKASDIPLNSHILFPTQRPESLPL